MQPSDLETLQLFYLVAIISRKSLYKYVIIKYIWISQIAVPEGSNTVSLNEALSPDTVDPDNVESIGVVVESATSSTPSITGIDGTVCCAAGMQGHFSLRTDFNDFVL